MIVVERQNINVSNRHNVKVEAAADARHSRDERDKRERAESTRILIL